MPKVKKNPLLTGLLNALLPGSVYLFVDHDRGRFIKTLAGGILAIAVLFVLGNAIQNVRGYALPQGLCPGILLLFVFVPLFLNGQKVAHLNNESIDSTADYNTHRLRSQGSNEEKLGQIEKMRAEGLISEQEYQKKKDGMSSGG